MDDINKDTKRGVKADDPEYLIDAIKICKSYNYENNPIDILKNADFKMKAGETVAVVGASGIGKTTLLNILGTLDKPDSGTFYFKGKDVFQFDDLQLAGFRNNSIGFIFQFHHLLLEFTALENAMMPAFIHGMKKKIACEAAEAVLVKVGLKDRLHHKVGVLSGGEQQRVALARALVLNPALILADEPTGNLDRHNSDKVHRLLHELNCELNLALMVITHNMELSSYMARQITIKKGQLLEIT